ncbi:S49 family peptidase [Salinadaptatus halalkaliphilus]|uniref:S49 family peptidase n=1 Tax=Salinadaptatus halalkaliphilus TaxID=2419781 RepID=A0A4S3TSK3_9EURY|nr:S49 family peptidase [Salinadaptatus halalkaliphilus]THE66690.1 S49 family peptidase [Salinadaptatus halalkaliphilus]
MSGTLPTIRSLFETVARSYVTIVVVALLVGAAIAPVAWGAASGPDGTVAVIEMDSSITEPTAEAVTDDLREARQNESIDAVVLVVDSPGGGVTASESLYLAVERTAQEMPVVTSVQSMGASGGYYMSAPSDKIYVNPGSMIGSIGVVATHVDQPTTDQQITTGPDKAGPTKAHATAQAETMKAAFLGAVLEHRGDELTITEDELAHANTYTGIDGVENGLADEIGDTDVAIGTAAEKAGLDDYEVEELSDDQPPQAGAILIEEGGEPLEDPHAHPQTFGDYGEIQTVAFLAMYGSVGGEPIADTREPPSATATHEATATEHEDTDEPTGDEPATESTRDEPATENGGASP